MWMPNQKYTISVCEACMCFLLMATCLAACACHASPLIPYSQHVQEEQMTALMFAVKVGSIDVVKLLVEHSASLFVKDSVSIT